MPKALIYISISLSFSLCLPSVGISQVKVDTIHPLPEVTVTTQALQRPSVGARSIQWMSSDIERQEGLSIERLLTQETGIYVRSYGGGGIATASIRGAGSAQALVTWNGVQVMSPTLGLQDFSILPIAAFDEARIAFGGGTASGGSGAIGGHIALASSDRIPDGLELRSHTAASNFGGFEQSIRSSYGNGNLGGQTRVYHSRAQNDFPFQRDSSLPEERLPHAAMRQTGIAQDIYWKPSERYFLKASVWWQEMQREIPPTLVQTVSEATQSDENIRATLDFKMRVSTLDITTKAAVFHDRLDFKDPLAGVDSPSDATTVFAQSQAEWSIDPALRISGGLSHMRISATTTAYPDRPVQNRSALFGSYALRPSRWGLQIDLRQELIDGTFAPFTFAVGSDVQILEWLAVRAKISRDYRIPAFNDLFWRPGGDPDLLPERGWSQEIGFVASHNLGNFSFNFNTTVFNRNIKNWILWTIREGEVFFSANNIARVHSRGVETRLDVDYTAGKWELSADLGYDFIRSTNEVAVEVPKIDEGQQLIYVPEHRAFVALKIIRSGTALEYRHNYTGGVLTDRSNRLPAFHIGNIYMEYNLAIPSLKLRPFFEIENIWNAAYQVIEFRPMPGRSYRFGLHFILNKSNK